MLRNAGRRHHLEELRTWIQTPHRQRSASAHKSAGQRKLNDLFADISSQTRALPSQVGLRKPRGNLDDLTPFGAPRRNSAPLDGIEPFGKRHQQSNPSDERYSNHRSEARDDVLRSRDVRSKKTRAPPVIKEEDIIPYFQSHVTGWAAQYSTFERLKAYGFPTGDSSRLLERFVIDVKQGKLSDPGSFTYYQLSRFSQPHEDNDSTDTIFNTVFFWWAARPELRNELEKQANVSLNTLSDIQRLVEATDRTFPADEFARARTMHRKIIMHVGPTNSGKTHHALRALAAAKQGVYAGPLRLLAHEIWERLNTGQIIPLGIEPDPSTISRLGNPEYARECNMVTGEEQKYVSDNAGLCSCTVEMLSYQAKSDVAVIDEIQMIGDPDRGQGWMNAVLGIAAKEVHLCGEETAVPIVQELLKHTGDKIEVRHYQRLTPLVVEETSLGGDYTKVRKGDCIVTFSRTNIFKTKKLVEDATGMRCAVVYGRLPPEIRSEQAALFNDPNSGYDVIIGSDAIGMGLNLKIKRVIFEATSKYQGRGKDHTPLSVSSVKQIAGRAGRFGLHGEGLGGTTTTLYEEDLPYLKDCIAQPYKPLPYARIGVTGEVVGRVISCLPENCPLSLVIDAVQCVGRLPHIIRYGEKREANHPLDYVDEEWSDMSIDDRMLLLYAPIAWRDIETTKVVKRLLVMHKQHMAVDLRAGVKGTGFIPTMELMERLMNEKGEFSKAYIPNTASTLLLLESFHKVITFYVWMSYRNPVVYSDCNGAGVLKNRLEMVLNWCLDSLSKQLALKAGEPSLDPAHRTTRPIDGVKYMSRLDMRKNRFENTKSMP